MQAKRIRKSDLFLFCVPLLIPLLYFGSSVLKKRLQKEVVSNVGRFEDERTEQIAVVKRLSQLLKEYPHATRFRIYGNHPEMRNHGTVVYIRKWENKPRHWQQQKYGENELHLDELPVPKNWPHSWPFSAVGNILDEDIHAIAQSSGVVKEIFRRASARYSRLDAARKNEEKKLGTQIDHWGRHSPQKKH